MIDTQNPERMEHGAGVALTSPLAEYVEGDVVPDVASLEDAQLCNDAIILEKSPFTVMMPAQQWAYGLLIPINTAWSAKAINALVIQMRVSVQSGEIGIAVVDDSLSNLITIEHFVSARRSLVKITVQNPKVARAIFLRTTSGEQIRPEVTIFSMTTHGPATARLIPRQHGLNFDLIVICSPPKTATQTVERTIWTVHPSVQVRRVHYISEKKAAQEKELLATLPAELATAITSQAIEADRVRYEIDLVRSLGGSVAIIIGTREPISRAIAGMFQSLPDTMPLYSQLRRIAAPLLIQLLSEAMIHAWREEQATDFEVEYGQPFGSRIACLDHFFRTEFLPLTGVDILERPFNRDAGYSIFSIDRLSILIYRFEDIRRSLAAGLSALFNRDIELISTNLSSEKPYADLYCEFISSITIPADLCESIYRSRYVQHFYSKVEIARFVSRWTRGEAETAI